MNVHPLTDQRDQARATANAKRLAVATLKRDIQAGRRSFADVVMDPPAETHGLLLIDLIDMTRRTRRGAGLATIGRLALRDRINLLEVVERSSTRERVWVAQHGTYLSRCGARVAPGELAA